MIKNDSTADIEVSNPLNYITIAIHNLAGVQVNRSDDSQFIDTKDPHIHHAGIVIEKVIRNGKEELLRPVLQGKLYIKKGLDDDFTDYKVITLPAKGFYEIFYAVPRILKPDAIKPYTTDQEIKIPSGRYQLYASVSIIKKYTSSQPAPVYSRFKIFPVIINYGVPLPQ